MGWPDNCSRCSCQSSRWCCCCYRRNDPVTITTKWWTGHHAKYYNCHSCRLHCHHSTWPHISTTVTTSWLDLQPRLSSFRLNIPTSIPPSYRPSSIPTPAVTSGYFDITRLDCKVFPSRSTPATYVPQKSLATRLQGTTFKVDAVASVSQKSSTTSRNKALSSQSTQLPTFHRTALSRLAYKALPLQSTQWPPFHRTGLPKLAVTSAYLDLPRLVYKALPSQSTPATFRSIHETYNHDIHQPNVH